MEVLLTKPFVVTLAIVGAVLSTLGLILKLRDYISETNRQAALNYAGYGVMGASMLLFVLAGLWR